MERWKDCGRIRIIREKQTGNWYGNKIRAQLPVFLYYKNKACHMKPVQIKTADCKLIEYHDRILTEDTEYTEHLTDDRTFIHNNRIHCVILRL